jgi:4-amino-4-deoxy-L-arabinose transferase-like glycosyltransferase
MVAPKVPDRRKLLALTLGGLLVRVAFLLLEPATRPIADERTWTNWAIENLVTEKVRFNPLRTRMIFYPPLYPYFIALPYELFGSLAAVKWAQALVSSLLVPAVGRVAALAFGPAAGLLAAAFAAFYPDFVWFSVHFWSETLFMVLLWWAFERLFMADRTRRLPPALAAGVLWGLSILVRETALYFTPLAALRLAFGWQRKGGILRGAAFLLAALVTVAPWTLRNWLVFRAFVPVSTAGSLNLFQGNARLTRQEVYDRYYAVGGRIEQHRYAQRMGVQAILERQPLWAFEKLRDEMPRFWEADSLALIHIKRGAYGDVPVQAARASWAVVVLPYLAALGLFLAGLLGLPLDRDRLLLVGFLVFYNALHVITHGFARYRLPIMPVVLMVAAWTVVEWRAGRYPALDLRRRLLAAALALLAVLTLLPSFRMDYADPAFGFAAPKPAGEWMDEAPPS